MTSTAEHSSTHTLLVDPNIDPDELMLGRIDTSEGPLYSVSEMAKVFFARSSHWVRWLEACHFPVPDPENPKRHNDCAIKPADHDEELARTHSPYWRMFFDGELLTPLRTKSNARKYDLAMIEKIAHALATTGVIDPIQLRQALLMVKIQAQMNFYLHFDAKPSAIIAKSSSN